MTRYFVRPWAVAAVAIAVASCCAARARADGLTFSAESPAGVGLGPTAANGAQTTVDGDVSFDGAFANAAAWTVSSSHLELTIEQRTDTQLFPPVLATGAFVFTVDEPCTYSLSGHLSYFPAVEGTTPTGDSYAIFNLQDATEDVYLFRNTLDASDPSEATLQVGDPTYLEGSAVGTLWPGRVYVIDFWVQTTNFNSPGPALAAEAVLRMDVAPFGPDELSAWADDLAASLASTPLSQVAAPNAASAAGRLASLVERVELASDAIADGDVAAATALLTSVLERIDGVAKPADWLSASPEQAALLAQVELLLETLD